MNQERHEHIRALEASRDSRFLVYFTGDRRGLETIIAPEAHQILTRHLDAIGDVSRLSLFLYTTGGSTLAAWSIANLLRRFCDELEVIVPSKALSAGTLMSLAADRIIMTKQATLGPIDPSVNQPLNPSIPGAPPLAKAPVSVEDIGGFIDFARSISDDPAHLNTALQLLATQVHPLVLGTAYRARAQIRMLARKLIGGRASGPEEVERLLAFLCSESGSHDYTIDRKEAERELSLPITKPDDALYALIKSLFDGIAEQLRLAEPFDPGLELAGANQGRYSHQRAIIESIPGGSDIFTSEGLLTTQMVPTPQGQQMAVRDDRHFEGWRHVDTESK